MKSHREVLRDVAKRQGSYAMSASFEAAVAYVMGYDHALDGALLRGFRGWLAVRTGDRPEVTWPGQVAHLAFPDHPDRWSAAGLTRDELEHLRLAWFRMLDEFLGDREARGLDGIEADYRAWLATVPWYDAEHQSHLDEGWR